MICQRQRWTLRWTKLCVILFYINVLTVYAAKLDIIKCGVDNEDTEEGLVINEKYPWIGVLFYTLYGAMDETRSVTTVVLIHEEFAIGNSADVGRMPKLAFRDKARVLFGEGWERHGRRVRNYIVHPEYGETINSVALIHLRQPFYRGRINPVCPPPERVRFPQYWVIKFEEKLEPLQKNVLPVVSVPADLCREFYITANLYEEKRRPSHALCATSVETTTPCVWGAGAALCTRDVWGRWQLLGLGVYGAGCGAPSRYLHMRYYYPWIEEMLDKFQRITISRINDHKYVLRSGSRAGSLMKFGECDEIETRNLIYRDSLNLYTDNNNLKTFRHNITIYDSVDYSCVTFELIRASASAQMRVQHFCPRGDNGVACYSYRGTRFDIAVEVIFTEACVLDIHAYGLHINMSLLDIQEWKWEEGTFYEDFRLTHVEYRGPTYATLFGFEPVDQAMWVPNYEVWAPKPLDPLRSTTTERYSQTQNDTKILEAYTYSPTTGAKTISTKPKKKFTKKTPKPTYWQLFKINMVFTGTFWVNALSAIWNWFASWG